MIFLFLIHSYLTFCAPTIIGGEVVSHPLQEAPFFVRVNDDCGGSLIDDSFVLTAAHCVSEEKSAVIQDLSGTKIKSRKITIHPLFKTQKKGIAYDFALIELPSRLNAQVITLGTDELKPGQMLTSYGFGRISTTTSEMSKVLRKLDEPFVASSISNMPDSYNGMITESMFTAGFSDGGKSPCQADSGGPLVDAKRRHSVLIGVVSWGEGCAKAKKYSVYSKVSHVREWIEEVVTKP